MTYDENKSLFNLTLDPELYSRTFEKLIGSYIDYCKRNVKTEDDWQKAHEFFKKEVLFKIEECEGLIFSEIIMRIGWKI